MAYVWHKGFTDMGISRLTLSIDEAEETDRIHGLISSKSLLVATVLSMTDERKKYPSSRCISTLRLRVVVIIFRN